MRTMLKLNLKFHPYKIVCMQQLLERDYGQKKDFASRIQVLHDEPNTLSFMSDEGHFHLNGFVKIIRGSLYDI